MCKLMFNCELYFFVFLLLFIVINFTLSRNNPYSDRLCRTSTKIFYFWIPKNYTEALSISVRIFTSPGYPQKLFLSYPLIVILTPWILKDLNNKPHRYPLINHKVNHKVFKIDAIIMEKKKMHKKTYKI